MVPPFLRTQYPHTTHSCAKAHPSTSSPSISRRLQSLAAFLPAETCAHPSHLIILRTETARCPTREMPAPRLSKGHTTLAERGFSHRNDGLTAQEDLENQYCWLSAKRSIFCRAGRAWLWSWSTTRNPSCQSPFPSHSQSPILIPFSHLHIRHNRSHKLLQCLSIQSYIL